MKRPLTTTAVIVLAGALPFIAGAQFQIPGGADEINQYISKLYTFGIGIGGILAVLMIVIGGIYYSVSGAVDKKSEGKEMILSALLGLLILFGSYLILQTVNPVLVTLKNPAIPEGLITTSTIEQIKLTQCPTTIVCPPQLVIPPGGAVNAGTIQGIYPIDEGNAWFGGSPNLPAGAFYAEQEDIIADEILWQHPYYVNSKTGDATIDQRLAPYYGPENARCIIYAEKECGPEHIPGAPYTYTLPGMRGLTNCTNPVINKIQLRPWLKPC